MEFQIKQKMLIAVDMGEWAQSMAEDASTDALGLIIAQSTSEKELKTRIQHYIEEQMENRDLSSEDVVDELDIKIMSLSHELVVEIPKQRFNIQFKELV